MNIVILDSYTTNPGDISWDELKKLGTLRLYDRTAPEDIIERAQTADCVLTNKTPLQASVLTQLPHLKYIGVLATGYNVVDTDFAKSRGIVVCNTPAYSTMSVAQQVFSFILEFCNKTALHNTAVHQGEWVESKDFSFSKAPLTELSGKTLGIMGLGEIGCAVAQIGLAFGMKVIAHTRTAKNRAAIREVDIKTLFATADFLSLTCPLTKETEHVVRKETLSYMKPSSLLINTGRGGLINEDDLSEALRQNVLAGAGLDVLSSEPPAQSNPLLTAPNCIISPHISWATQEARRRLISLSAQNIAAYLKGTPINCVSL